MKTKKKKSGLKCDLTRLSWLALCHVIEKAEEWQCSPAEACMRILNERATIQLGRKEVAQ